MFNSKTFARLEVILVIKIENNCLRHTNVKIFWGIIYIDQLLPGIKMALKELFRALIDPLLSNYVIFNFENRAYHVKPSTKFFTLNMCKYLVN